MSLFDNGNLLAQTVTGPDGSFCFGPLQWRQNFRIVMGDPAPVPPTCNPPIADVPPPLGPFHRGRAPTMELLRHCPGRAGL